MHFQGGTKIISDNKKICIIGAGASGITAAIAAAECGARITVLEHKESALKKLALTGNGKCNFTNRFLSPSCYHERKDSRLADFIKRFKTDDAVRFFHSLGIETTESYGYYYPRSENAAEVAEKLLDKATQAGVEILYNQKNIDILALRDIFDSIIISTGSFAYKKTGSNGSGYKFLETLGIEYSRVLPALCPLYTDDEDFLNKHHGKRILGRLDLIIDEKIAATQFGEMQINENNLSGIAVFNLSRYASRALDAGKMVRLSVDTDIDSFDLPRIISSHSSDMNIKRSFNIVKTARFDKSQVCTGGVSLSLLTDRLEVIDHPGVFLSGEICDVDGICGGYNLHWAWASGHIAGKGAAQ